MNSRTIHPILLSLGLALVVPLAAQNQTVNGNLTVTGTIGSAGAIDSDSNTFSFGTQGASFGSALIYQDANADTVTFSANRSPASWLWQHLTGVAAMRLDANHQLILYQADGTTAGVTFTPASNRISLGTATLTATGTALSTNGAFTVTGGLTNTSGVLTGGATGLAFEAGGTNQNITLNSSGGDLVFSTGGTERARIKSTGYVGIGTANPASRMHLLGAAGTGAPSPGGGAFYLQDSGGSGNNGGALLFGAAQGYWAGIKGLINDGSSNTTGELAFFTRNVTSDTSLTERLRITSAGNVGIGTTSPGARLDVAGNGRFTGGGTFGYAPAVGMHNGLILGTAAKATAPAGGQGTILIASNDATNPFQGFASLITDPTAGNRRLTIGSVEQNVTWRNITLNEGGGNVGIGTSAPASKFEVVDSAAANGTISRLQRNAKTLEFYTGSLVDLQIGTPGNHSLGFYTNNSDPLLTLTAGQNVGIGTTNPDGKLALRGEEIEISMGRALVDTNGYARTGFTSDYFQYITNNARWIGGAWNYVNLAGYGGVATRLLNSYGAFQFDTASGGTNPIIWNTRLFVANNGNVGIGTITPSHKLAVKGTIRANEVIVDTGWADYVFDESYRLAPLSEVEAHIKTTRHLPGIPSAAEVAEHGVSMGDMQAKLLSKVEELTLHLIAQEKTLAAQNERLGRLENENRALRSQLNGGGDTP